MVLLLLELIDKMIWGNNAACKKVAVAAATKQPLVDGVEMVGIRSVVWPSPVETVVWRQPFARARRVKATSAINPEHGSQPINWDDSNGCQTPRKPAHIESR